LDYLPMQPYLNKAVHRLRKFEYMEKVVSSHYKQNQRMTSTRADNKI